MENIDENIQQIRDLIASAKLGVAIGYLLDFVLKNSEYLEKIYKIKYRISDLKRENIEGVISDSDARVERTRIVRDLLNILEPIRQEYLIKRKRKVDRSEILATINPVAFKGENIGTVFIRKRQQPFKLFVPELTLREGEVTGVIGANGSGKTSLIKIVSGLILPSRESILEYNYDSTRLQFSWVKSIYRNHLRWFCVKKRISVIQEDFSTRASTVLKTLIFEATKNGLKGEKNLREVEFFLQRFDLSEVRNSRCAELSKGFQLRLELAIALVKQPRILILDEPLAHLDASMRQQFLLDLKSITQKINPSISTIFTSHQVIDTESVADNILYLENGSVGYYGEAMIKSNVKSSKNYFEFYTPNYKHLEKLRQKKEITIVQIGFTYIAITSKEIDFFRFTSILEDYCLEIHYIRDITFSLRRKILAKNIKSKFDII